jgi:hypothetical protein
MQHDPHTDLRNFLKLLQLMLAEGKSRAFSKALT